MNTNHDALREALKPFAKLFHSLQADFDGPLPTAFDATISTEDVRRAAYALSQPEAAAQCWCETCRPVTLNDMRMVLCPDCGNKRCPKATHHDNACTNSNEVGQPGSSWVNVKPLSASPAAPDGCCEGKVSALCPGCPRAAAPAQPQAQGEPTVGWVHGWELERANESKRWAMKECRELREAIAKRDAALVACVEALQLAQRNGSAGLHDYELQEIYDAITQANEVLGRKEGK